MPSSRFSSTIFQVIFFNKSYFLLEPVGTRAPKVIAESKFKYSEAEAGADVPILCPPQGFPVPSFR